MTFVTRCKCGRNTTLGIMCVFCLEGQYESNPNEKAEPIDLDEFGPEEEKPEEDD